MYLVRKICFCVLFLLFSGLVFSQQQYPKTLLWRISGKGLKEPSYLFGTMHLNDKRLFRFDDSVYRAMEKSQGLAIEVNPDEMAAYSINKMFDELENSRKVSEILDENDYNKYEKALARKFKKSAEDVTAKDIVQEKNKWVSEYFEKGEMPTFVDAYLYNIARKQGKWVGGIEDIADQADLMEDMVDKTDIELLLTNSDNEDKDFGAGKINELIKTYINEDIEAINTMINDDYSEDKKDLLLIKRNVKMALRMDSLSAERSMFFAVGAAHLPGDSGVIDLLKKRGFTVEPVMCNTKTEAKDYKFKEVVVPWYDVKDAQNLYNVQMPGNPASVKLFGLMDMKFLLDIFNMSGFCTMAVVSPRDLSDPDKLYDQMVFNMFKTRKKVSSKKINRNSIEGREYIHTKDNATIRVQVYLKDKVVYMAMMYAMKKETIASADAEKFFNSFAINTSAAIEDAAGPLVFADSVIGISFKTPAVLTYNEKMSSEANGWKIAAYTGTDMKNGAYIMFFSKTTAPGSYIINDTIISSQLLQMMDEKISDINKEDIRLQDFKGMVITGKSKAEDDIHMKVMSLVRGNKNMMLMLIADDKHIEEPELQSIFSSFSFIPYRKDEWQQQYAPGRSFSAWAPGAFTEMEKEEYSSDERSKVLSYDSVTASSYLVITDTLSKYYWYSSDSAFWNANINNYKSETDSLLSVSTVNNGSANGRELVIQEKGSETYKRVRLLLHGNIMYSIFTADEKNIVYGAPANKFFEGFAIHSTPADFNAFASKADLLIKDLSAKDSATRKDAYTALYEADISEKDIPLLQEALFKTYEKVYPYGDSTAINDRIANHLQALKTETTVKYIKEHHYLLQQQPLMKNVAAELLAGIHTKESYQALIELLKESPLPVKPGYYFGTDLKDSLALTAEIYPALLTMAKDSMLTLIIADLSLRLLDSGFVNPEEIQKAEKDFIAHAAYCLSVLKDSSDYYEYGHYSLIRLLGKLNTESSMQMINEYLSVADMYMRKEAAILLLKNNQPVSAAVLLGIAADMSVRTELYTDLKEISKTSLFPAKYLTQPYFAESAVYYAASDEDEPSSVKFLSEKVSVYKGKKYKFYLYKVTFGTGNDAYSHLGIAGGYALAEKSLEPAENISGLYWNEEFDDKTITDQFKAYVAEFENSSEEE